MKAIVIILMLLLFSCTSTQKGQTFDLSSFYGNYIHPVNENNNVHVYEVLNAEENLMYEVVTFLNGGDVNIKTYVGKSGDAGGKTELWSDDNLEVKNGLETFESGRMYSNFFDTDTKSIIEINTVETKFEYTKNSERAVDYTFLRTYSTGTVEKIHVSIDRTFQLVSLESDLGEEIEERHVTFQNLTHPHFYEVHSFDKMLFRKGVGLIERFVSYDGKSWGSPTEKYLKDVPKEEFMN